LNYNDVDFGFKIIDAGLRIIWTPTAELFHFESKTRSTVVDDSESALLYRLWGRHMMHDPYMPAPSVKTELVDEPAPWWLRKRRSSSR
jgi:O-antigen biosynthesis protein